MRPGRAALLPAVVLLFIMTGLGLALAGSGRAGLVWSAGLGLTGPPVVWRTVRGIAAGRFAADLVTMIRHDEVRAAAAAPRAAREYEP